MSNTIENINKKHRSFKYDTIKNSICPFCLNEVFVYKHHHFSAKCDYCNFFTCTLTYKFNFSIRILYQDTDYVIEFFEDYTSIFFNNKKHRLPLMLVNNINDVKVILIKCLKIINIM